jgi:protein-tyrosine phosphatase
VIEDGGSVLVHCKAGVHRSVAQAACVLIGMGYTADDAMELIKEKRAVADPDAGYIQKRIRKFENQWQSQINQS